MIIPAILNGFSSLKDKTLKLTFETNEPTPEQFTEIAKHIQQFGYLAFQSDAFKSAQLNDLKNLKAEYQDTTKSPSKRLRNVLYVYWQQDNKGYSEFDEYYEFQMNVLIEHFKSKLI